MGLLATYCTRRRSRVIRSVNGCNDWLNGNMYNMVLLLVTYKEKIREVCYEICVTSYNIKSGVM